MVPGRRVAYQNQQSKMSGFSPRTGPDLRPKANGDAESVMLSETEACAVSCRSPFGSAQGDRRGKRDRTDTGTDMPCLWSSSSYTVGAGGLR
jgi:hypothetical protein